MAEDQVLVVLDAALAVEVDVEQLVGPQRLREARRVVQAGHLLVARLRVEADDVAVLELGDEAERVADGRQEDVAAGLVRLGLERDAQLVALLLDVRGDGVDAVRVRLVRGVQVLGRVVLGTLTAAPHDERVGVERRGEVDVAQDLAQRVATHAAVVGRERAVLEHRVGERVRRDHLDRDAGLGQGAAETVEDLLALGVRRAERDHVVVVERHVGCAELGELVDRLDRVEPRTRGCTERVLRVPADGPQTEGELVGGGGLAHHQGPLNVEMD
ncbi:hypothetical protein CPER28S_02292 [Cellulomonas persica]